MKTEAEILKDKIVLVTGGAGFIGSHICEELINLGAKVVCFDDLSTGSKKNIEAIGENKGFEFVQGDVNNREDLEYLFSKHSIDYVIHLAATVGVKRTLEFPDKVLKDLNGIKNIFSLSFTNRVKKVVFASSSEVYGEPEVLPETEDGKTDTTLPYARVKLEGEKIAREYYLKHGLPTTSLRYFNVFGPRQEGSDYGFVVGIFIKQVLKNTSPTVVGDGSMTRNFVFVKDTVNATIKTLWRDESDGEVLNIGTGKSITILELANKIIKISGKNLAPRFIPMRNEFEIMHREPDTSKMTDLLDYRPAYKFEESLLNTYDWYKNFK